MLLCTCSSVLAFCESIITLVIGRLMQKCWHHISLFTSHLAQWFVNQLCSFSLEVACSRQSDFDFFLAEEGHIPLPRPYPCYWTFWHFFQKPTLNNPSVMCIAKILLRKFSLWLFYAQLLRSLSVIYPSTNLYVNEDFMWDAGSTFM